MIICAALDISCPEENLMVCGYRHADCYEALFRLNAELSKHARKHGLIKEGFLATGNRFLDRYEAYQEAMKCGQIPASLKEFKADIRENALFSEDLY